MKESLLWSVKKKGSEIEHFLFGTMHVKSAQAYSFAAKAIEKINLTHTYIGEMNLNDPDLDNIHEYFMLEDGEVSDLLPPKKYAKTRKAILKSFGVDIDTLAFYKPIVVSNMIAESVLTEEYDVALDHYLWQYAVEQNKNCQGLESAEDQFQIMLKIPMEYQVKSLLECAKDTSKFRKKVMKMSKYYEEGRLTDLYKFSKKSMKELRKLMIYDRNINMANRLMELMDESSCFCSVGAAHLGGNKGMLAILKKHGYKVKSI